MYPELCTRLRGFLRRFAFEPATVDDIVHDTLVRAHAARTRFEPRGVDPESAVFSWYIKIAHNLATDHMRGCGGRRTFSTVVEHVDLSTPETVLDERRCRARAKAQVDVALRRLGTNERSLVKRTKLDGERPAALARENGIKPGAMRARVHRAFNAFRRELECVTGVPCQAA